MISSILLALICHLSAWANVGDNLPNNNLPNKNLPNNNGFDVVGLGVKGGIQDGNLTAFMISPHDDPASVLCDAGTITNGIKVAIDRGAFSNVKVPSQSPLSKVGYISNHLIKGYLITHSHLDHVTGLMIASVDDTNKSIYALSPTINTLKNSLFNWQAWPNFTNDGVAPTLNKYTLQAVDTNAVFSLTNTNMTARAFELSHNGVVSTAFLIRHQNSSILCVGDTGPDAIESGNKLAELWQVVADEIVAERLKAIIIEVSYLSARPDKQLFGHLTPKHLLLEMKRLASSVELARQHSQEKLKTQQGRVLEDLPIVISHIKYSLKKEQNLEQTIEKELASQNTLGLKFIIPKQGQRWHFN